MRTSLEKKRRQYRTIYENIFEIPRIKPKPLSRIMDLRPSVVETRIKEAFNLGHIIGPHLRKRSYHNFEEYMYFVNCKDPVGAYLNYRKDLDVIYHAKVVGFCNLWVVSNKEIDIKGDVVLKGLRSDYHVSFAPDHSWDQTIQIMRKMVENFDPEEYSPKGIIKTHRNESFTWGKEDELLYRYFKYGLRKSIAPIRRKHRIPRDKILGWLKALPEFCTIATSYFPKTLSAYDPYLFVFETDYEDFIIDLFSQLPTSSLFLKVSDRLLFYAHVEKELLRSVGPHAVEFTELQIPLLIRDLLKRKIIKNEGYSITEYYWGKDL